MTHGSLFTGIGGFDLGFERAGWESVWQVEQDAINRAVLAKRFPHAERFQDVRTVRDLAQVDLISAGFPCQDISANGKRVGIDGARSGLAWDALRIVSEVRPKWVVFENVSNFIAINNGDDFARFIRALSDCGYVGKWRVLNAAGFGIPQKRERVFIVAGLGTQPPEEFLADALPVEALPSTSGKRQEPRSIVSWQGYTLGAENARGRLCMGGELLIAHPDGWGEMAERARASEIHGIPIGLDDVDVRTAYSAGNAVVPAIAEWIGQLLAGQNQN